VIRNSDCGLLVMVVSSCFCFSFEMMPPQFKVTMLILSALIFSFGFLGRTSDGSCFKCLFEWGIVG